MLNDFQATFAQVFAAISGTMQTGAEDLFYISVLCSLPFIAWEIIRALDAGGGGSIIATAGYRLFVIAGFTALVWSWTPLGNAIRLDFEQYAASIATQNPYVGTNFTPDGILAANDKLTARISIVGANLGFIAQAMMLPYKMVASVGLEAGTGILAYDLLFANISMSIVFGACVVFIGTFMNPWLSSFAMEVVKLIGGTLAFKILVGVFCAVGGTLSDLVIGYLDRAANVGLAMSGNDMIFIGGMSLIFGFMAVIVPGAIAWKIAGGVPVFQLGQLVAASRQMPRL